MPFVFFEKPAKNLPSKASSSETENCGSKKVEGRSPFLHPNEGGRRKVVAMAPELRSLGASQMDSRDHHSSVLDLSPTGVEAWMPFL